MVLCARKLEPPTADDSASHMVHSGGWPFPGTSRPVARHTKGSTNQWPFARRLACWW